MRGDPAEHRLKTLQVAELSAVTFGWFVFLIAVIVAAKAYLMLGPSKG